VKAIEDSLISSVSSLLRLSAEQYEELKKQLADDETSGYGDNHGWFVFGYFNPSN
jgi:hypothetical protein